MKSIRKTKLTTEATLQQKAISTGSLKAADPVDQNTGEDWLPRKVLLKPGNQLQLTEKELNEELTRILNANNPHAPQNIARYSNKERLFKASPNMEHTVFHFDYDGESEEDVAQDATPVAVLTNESQVAEDEMGTKVVTHPNQFTYSERAAQTLNNSYREKGANTEPPPQRTCSYTVNQWSIYDAYMDDIQQREKIAKEKAKNTSSTGTKGHKDEDKSIFLPPADSHAEEVYYKNSELKKSILIMERMCNQNTFDDVSQDFKYWDAASDELGDKSGKLLPLWKFVYEKEKKKQVTAVAWNTHLKDLFAVGYGSYDFSSQGPGLIACFTLKNPSFPEMIFNVESGVMCIDFHPKHPNMLAVGLYDGSVMVYNVQNQSDSPIYRSAKHGRHTDPVWQVQWQKDDLDDNLNFCSISSDGRITQWTLDLLLLKYDDSIGGSFDDDKIFSLAAGCSFDFHGTQEQLFVVGTEEGKIYKCSKDYSSQYFLKYEGHQMAVYAVKFNPFNGNYFLSVSADWTVKLWDLNEAEPIMTYDLNGSVGDVAWSPYSSAVFAAVNAEGKLFIFDLSQNKYAPVCEQQIVKKAKLTHLSFSNNEPIILVGDDRGTIVSVKLPPTLRKEIEKEEQAPRLTAIINAAQGKPAY